MYKNEKKSLSVIILALNESGNIKQTVELVIESAKKNYFYDFEIIVVDGGSTDGTQRVIEELVLSDSHVKSVYNHGKMGMGRDFKSGLALASKEFVGWFPGDNETFPETVDAILGQVGEADIIIPYTINPEVRSVYRRLLSNIYTSAFNRVFGLKLKYFNGPCFFRRDLLRTVEMTTDGPAYMAEILIQLIKKNGASYIEVPMRIRARDYGKSSVLKWKNVWEIAKTAASLFFRIYIVRKS